MSGDAAFRHLRGDPILAPAVAALGPLPALSPGRDHFATICRSIVAQQLSVAAARTIWGRCQAQVADWTPGAVALCDPASLRSCGLSGAKVRAIGELAARLVDGGLRLDDLGGLDDEAATARLLSIRGIGPWSVEMYLIFQLARPDVFSLGDAGLRRAFAGLAGLDPWNYQRWAPELSAAWRPYRSLACRYLWAWLDTPGAGP